MTQRRRDDALGVGLLSTWCLLQVGWLAADGRWVAGDELGNIEAVRDLTRALETSLVGWAAEVLVGARGEYPNLHAGVLSVAARVVSASARTDDFLALTSLAWGVLLAFGLRLAAGRGAWSWPLALTLASPLLFGLGHHTMLENGAVAVAPWLVWAATRAQTVRAAAALGVVGAVALLLKQTTLPLVAACVGWSWWRRGRTTGWKWAVSLLFGLSPAFPWYALHAPGQLSYAASSMPAAEGSRAGWDTVGFYAAVITQQAWPAAIGLPLVAALVRARRRVAGPAVVAALCLGLALTAVPKKYPRAVAPAIPLLALAGGVAIRSWSVVHQRLLGTGLLAGLISNVVLPGAPAGPLAVTAVGIRGVDSHCLQTWIRAPGGPEFPWSELVDAVQRSGESEVWITSLDWPSPECSYQGTYGLREHLDAQLRLRGVEGRTLDKAEAEERWARGDHVAVIAPPEGLCTRWAGACAAGIPPRLASVRVQQPEWTIAFDVYDVGPPSTPAP